MKMIIVTVGYKRFAMLPDDFAKLCAVGRNAVEVDREVYNKPFRPVPGQRPLVIVEQVELAEFDQEPLPEEEITAPERPMPAPSAPDDDRPF